MADSIIDQDTKRWTGARRPIPGMARVGGKIYRFIGGQPREVPLT